MIYNRTQYKSDKKIGIFRVMGVCFEKNEGDNKIAEVLSEILNMHIVAPSLMTREALCLYVKAPKYVSDRMATMPIDSSFDYNGFKITRCSKFTYNGKIIWVGNAVSKKSYF